MFITFFFEHGIGKPQSLRDRKHNSLVLPSENQWTLYLLPRVSNGGNLKIIPLKRKFIFHISIFGFHVTFQGCT